MMQLGRITLNPFWSFTFQFVAWSFVLFGLIYFEDFSPLVFINNLQTDLTAYLTHGWILLFNIDINMKEALLTFENGLKLRIVNECNGLAAFLVFLAAVIAYPTSKKEKLFWIFLSYFILLIANAVRLDWIAYHVIENPEDFKFAHEVLGRYIIASIPLFLFYIFSTNVSINSKIKPDYVASLPTI